MNESAIDAIYRLMPRRTRQLVPLRSLQGWRELRDDLASDSLVRDGKVSCKTHLFFIAGLPKSGTTWFEQLLTVTPGLVQLNTSCLRSYPRPLRLPHAHDVIPDCFACAPKNRLSFLKLHMRPSDENLRIIDSLGVRPVVIIRDLRDMLISRYHHLVAAGYDWGYQGEVLKKLRPSRQRTVGNTSAAPRLQESIMAGHIDGAEPAIDYYSAWISGWLDRIEEKPEDTMLIKYEEMTTDLFLVLRRLFDFYGYQISMEGIQEVIEKHQKAHLLDSRSRFQENLKKPGRSFSTFREGKIGKWRECFDKQMKDYFKQRAGQTLIRAGYEKDLSW